MVLLPTDTPLWTDASELGDISHLADPANGTNLVVVLHTELFRRYPKTIVYLTPNAGGAVTWGAVPDVDDLVLNLKREYPTFSGTLTPELVFFGFGVPPSAGADHWLVLEEPPPGYRFKHPAANASVHGAAFAAATFAPPVRVFFGNLSVTAYRDERQTAREPGGRPVPSRHDGQRARRHPGLAAGR